VSQELMFWLNVTLWSKAAGPEPPRPW
jgi:hypothetical protein